MMSIIFFFNDTATTEIYTLSLHDALPICSVGASVVVGAGDGSSGGTAPAIVGEGSGDGVGSGGKVGSDRKSTRLNSSHANISYAVFCLKKKHKTASLTIVLRDYFLFIRLF